MPEGKLTPKQELFVSEYLKTGNATEAIKRAGYACKTDNSAAACGARMLRIAKVSRAIGEKQKKRNDRLELEEDFEMKMALKLMEMCMEPKQVVDMNGDPVVDDDGRYVMSFDSKGANTALQTLAKLRGKFVTKVQVGLADDLSTQLLRIPDDVDEP